MMQTKHCPHVFLNTSWRHFWRASENEWKSSCFHLHPPHGWPGWLPEAFYLDWCDSSPLRSCYLLPPLWMIQIPPYKCINGDAYIYVRLKMWGWLFWYNILDDIPGVTLEVGFIFFLSFVFSSFHLPPRSSPPRIFSLSSKANFTAAMRVSISMPVGQPTNLNWSGWALQKNFLTDFIFSAPW